MYSLSFTGFFKQYRIKNIWSPPGIEPRTACITHKRLWKREKKLCHDVATHVFMMWQHMCSSCGWYEIQSLLRHAMLLRFGLEVRLLVSPDSARHPCLQQLQELVQQLKQLAVYGCVCVCVYKQFVCVCVCLFVLVDGGELGRHKRRNMTATIGLVVHAAGEYWSGGRRLS